MSIEHEAVERIARVLALHELAPAYAECTHDIPDFCVPVEASGFWYPICDKSFEGWSCRVCCFHYDDGYLMEECTHGTNHVGVVEDHACPTRELLVK